MNTHAQVASIAQANTEVSGHIVITDGQPTTTTQDIADVYGKRHDDVLRIVRKRMIEAGEWRLRNFAETVIERPNPSGGAPIKSPVIRMTKKGFHFVVGKFTGAKAVQHQIAFADEFERMESELKDKATEAPQPLLPAGQFTREVEVAIERRAHTLSLRQYDKIKEQLREAIQKWGKDLAGQKLVEFIQTIDLPDSQLVIVHRDTLWRLTARLSTLEAVQRQALEAVHALEQETRMPWYGRD